MDMAINIALFEVLWPLMNMAIAFADNNKKLS